MQFHTLKRNTKNKRKVAVGRGGRRGKTSGRGTKGQGARAGRKKRPELRDIIKRLPKLRGRGTNFLKSITAKPKAVNIAVLEVQFKAGEIVSPQTLVTKDVVSSKGGVYPVVKILGDGDLTKKLMIENCLVSSSARKKIEAAGGEIK